MTDEKKKEAGGWPLGLIAAVLLFGAYQFSDLTSPKRVNQQETQLRNQRNQERSRALHEAISITEVEVMKIEQVSGKSSGRWLIKNNNPRWELRAIFANATGRLADGTQDKREMYFSFKPPILPGGAGYANPVPIKAYRIGADPLEPNVDYDIQVVSAIAADNPIDPAEQYPDVR